MLSQVHAHKFPGQFPRAQFSLHHLSMPAFPCHAPIAWQDPDGGPPVGGPAEGGWVLGSGHGEGMGGLVPPPPPPNACLTAFIRGYLSETGLKSVDN